MEWVETTGKTIAEAKERALDGLGVDDADAEFEILQEPRTGLFGRVRTEARIRARVRPTAPPAKEDRRDRRRRRRTSGSAGEASGQAETVTEPRGRESVGAQAATGESNGPAARGRGSSSGGPAAGTSSPRGRRRSHRSRQGNRPADSGSAGPEATATAVKAGATGLDTSKRAGASPKGRAARGNGASANAGPDEGEEAGMEVALEEQGRVAQAFLTGVVEEMGLQAAVDVQPRDEETVEVVLSGEDLGVLIGSRGATLYALQDLTRTVVQRKTRAENGRLLVDVGGYRQKRQEALVRFVQKVAGELKESGGRKALEPMNAADRKVVHDTVNEIEGVTTVSEGEDSSRHVVLIAE